MMYNYFGWCSVSAQNILEVTGNISLWNPIIIIPYTCEHVNMCVGFTTSSA